MQSRSRLLLVSLATSAVVASSLSLGSMTPKAQAADAAAAVLSTLGAHSVADIAEAAAPAVVNIEVIESGKGDNEFSIGAIPGLPPSFQFFFNGNGFMPGDQGGTRQVPRFEKRDTGSGFIVRPNGFIVTNSHVVKDADKIKVTLSDKRTFDGKVIGLDPFSDLAVIKIDAENLPTLKMGSSTGLRPGEFAVAIGSPLGYDHTVTLGIISAVGRSVIDVNGNINFIQTDAAINPGNSGGPLLNLQGEVIGVNTAIRRDAQNIGFSIPVDVAKDVAGALISDGKILRPWLGIQMHELDEALIKSIGVPAGTKGVVIVGFVDNSPAKNSGLQLGDVIQKIDGKEMARPKDVKEYVQTKKVSDKLNFLVFRKNAVEAVAVNIGDYADVMDKQQSALAPRRSIQRGGSMPPSGGTRPKQ